MTSPNSILLKQLNEYKKPYPEPSLALPLQKDDPRPPIQIKLINFEFYPKKVRIPIGTLVRWEIGPNQSVYSSIYNSCERSFFLCIEELDIQSPQMFAGSFFQYRFMQEGVFEVVCLNYSRVKSVVTVVAENKFNDFLESYSNNLPIHYNRELKLDEKWDNKRKEAIEKMKKNYLNDFHNDFIDQIDQELDFKIMEQEATPIKETSESGSKTTDLLDVSNSVPFEIEITPKKMENNNKFEECSDLKEIVKKVVLEKKDDHLKIEIEKMDVLEEKEMEMYCRVRNFLEMRHNLTAFFAGKK